MRGPHIIAILLSCSTLALAGCNGGGDDAALSDEPDMAPEALSMGGRPPPAGLNGLPPSCFWATGSQQALRTLGGGALDQGGNTFAQVSLGLVPLGCRVVLAKAVQCALPKGVTLTDPVTGDQYGGWWGLAPGWQTAALDPSGRRYVTACLGETLNGHGDEVPIVLEGPNLTIAQNASLDSTFTIKESTVFGDLFSSSVPLLGLLPAFKLYVCWDGVLPQSCGLPLLSERMCDDLVLCGMVPLGPCSLFCASNGPYNKCNALSGLLPPYVTETVRVRLDPATCQ